MKNELVRQISTIQDEIDALTKQIEGLQAQITLREEDLNSKKKELLEGMQSKKLDEYHDEEHDLFATVFSKKNIGYSDEKGVISLLKEKGFGRFVKVKTTESLDKNPLKKEVKSNKELEGLLKPLIVESTTTYVVVTTGDNHGKMLEHIEKGKEKK